jgi:hypothetical protein
MTDNEIKESTEDPTKEEIKRRHLAMFTLSPSYNAAAVIAPYASIYGEQDIGELALHLLEISEKQFTDKNLNHSEEMLLSQAHALQAIFTNLSRRAFNNEQIDYFERYMRLALKAQAQSARTLEVLATMRNPASVAFVKQANIGQAVQVNNGIQPQTPHASQSTRASENLNPTNELLEIKDGQRLDSRTTRTTSSIDSPMETMEQVDRTQDKNR